MARGTLDTYNAKRDFKKTREPHGKMESRQSKRRFVVQRHEASHLHWDFRLEIEGVLKSWAVPREPSLDPNVKRLAVQVEDHPISYRTFEGDIPEGEYGAGHVDIWDEGTWICLDDDASSAYDKGSLTFELKGRRLKGRWHLIRTRKSESKPQWLLFKGKDAAARVGQRTESRPRSEAPGRRRALRARSKSSTKKFELTSPDRVLYDGQGITKQDLADYFELVSERMLPHVENRILTVFRCPRGRSKFCFIQKHFERESGPGLETIETDGKQGRETYSLLTSADGFKSLAQIGALELHVWGSKAPALERPDQLVFDLDPDVGVEFKRTIEAARLIAEKLEGQGLHAFVKLSGGKGLHVHAPLDPKPGWDKLHAFAEKFSRELAAERPDLFTVSSLKKERKKRIFLDYLRNSRGVSYVAPYSPRAKENAPVAAPIEWKELTSKIKPNSITLSKMKSRLKKPDPWKDFWKSARPLPKK